MRGARATAARDRVLFGWLAVCGATCVSALAEAQANSGPMEDIRDVRGPLSAPLPWWQGLIVPASVVLGVLLLGLILYATRAVWRRPKSPSALALARIAQAEARAVSLGARAFAEEVSEAVRAFIEARFSVHAPRRTTEELLGELARDPASPLAPHRAALSELLSCADFVKFAGAGLGAQDMARLAALAREFVVAGAAQESASRGLLEVPGGAA